MRQERIESLKKRLSQKILVLDGATGTALQAENLNAEDFGGEKYEGCNEQLVFTRPDIIEKVHLNYLQSGADIVETNTFGGTPFVLDEYELGAKAYEVNKTAAELARKACEQISTPEWPRFVAGSIGPTTKAISVTGGISFDELSNNFYEQARGLYDGGADYFLVETCQDTINIKACLVALDRLHQEVDIPLPIAVSGTIEPMGTMLAGQGVESLVTALAHRDLFYIGLNCATGPEFMTDHIRTLAELTDTPISCVPNAGLPDEDGNYLENPEMVAEVLERFIESNWINVIGGCCGTTHGHVEALRALADKHNPRTLENRNAASRLSGIDFLEITEDMRPVLVGERTNVIGSRKFKQLVEANKWEEGAEIARGQVKGGAAIIDVCLANPDRDELEDMKAFLPEVVKKVKAPIMIDSTDPNVIEQSLKYIQGKSIINSINLEDGEERFDQVVPLAKQYGAAFVVGLIDDDPEQGMGVSLDRKLEIAEREYKLLTEKFAIAPEDIYWDTLVFPCGTGDEQYMGSAPPTIEAITELKKKYPGTRSVLGISNVSFGLPNNGREVLNSVFLYHCVQAGLDLAIVNSQKLHRFASLSEEEVKVSDDLLWNRGADPIASFSEFFRRAAPKEKVEKAKLPLDDRLAQYVIEGSKDGLVEDLDLKLKEMQPLEIINGPLMKGMDRVGYLFNRNELIVAEVLQSAEAMKAAVAHLEQFMDKNESSVRGKVVLATVKGDVHDIGKNLVDIILSNNGFEVINLGIKIASDKLIEAVKEHKPDILGLSGLLVKSAQQMEIAGADLKAAGVEVPIFVGGAALTQNFTDRRIAKAYDTAPVVYAKDAMTGLNYAKTILDDEESIPFLAEIKERQHKIQSEVKKTNSEEQTEMSTERSKQISVLESIPTAPDFERHFSTNFALEEIWNYINNIVLYSRHLGLPGAVVKDYFSGDKAKFEANSAKTKFLKLESVLQELRGTMKSMLTPKAIYQFFPCASEGNSIYIYAKDARSPEDKPIKSYTFPRQRKVDGLCLADYVRPKAEVKKFGFDSLAMFIVTAGKGIREKSLELKESGEFLRSHALSVYALETAEAFAEYLHAKIREQWGFADSDSMTMMERFQAKYQGCRYSFGYPACPNLEDQRILFDLLKAEETGVELTEGFMMDPEASVTAIAFHHPDAKYFSV